MNKLCAVCDNYSSSNSIFCKDCEIIYKGVEKESWFVELTTLMKRQRQIDYKERFSIYDQPGSSYSYKNRNKGRPKVSLVVIELIKNIKRDFPNISIREIEEMCKKSDIFVSRETIRRILTQK
jgi:hypothetical protein